MDSGESARAGALLGLGVAAAGGALGAGQDAAGSDEEDLTVGELLLKLAGEADVGSVLRLKTCAGGLEGY